MTGSGQPWHVGDTVDDRYHVREVVTGGMGVVCRVHHRAWHVDLAVKTPLGFDERALRSFEAEARTWVDLGLHPHVAACVYVRRIDGLPRVFAEWVDGGDLHDAVTSGRLHQGDALPQILDIVIQFAWGIAHAHSNGLVHRDVKPRNALLTADGIVKVTDFGLASGLDARAHTPAYCSPEQAAGAPVTASTDVWSWAISVWMLFAGYPPVRHGQIAHHAFDARPSSGERVPMPADVAALLRRCLDPDPAARPHDIGTLADELVLIYQRLVGTRYPRARPEAATLVADGLNNQALSMLDLGHPERAAEFWDRALAGDPHNVHAVYNRGLWRWRGGRITDAELVAAITDERLLAMVQRERHEPLPAPLVLAGHTNWVTCVAVSADGSVAVSGSRDTTVRVWDVRSGRCLHTLTGHDRYVTSVEISADGRVAVSGGQYDDVVLVWDVAAGRLLRRLRHLESVTPVAVSDDGSTAVTRDKDRILRTWDLGTGRCLRVHTESREEWPAVSADGAIAVTAAETIRTWDLQTGACLRTVAADVPPPPSPQAVSRDGAVALFAERDRLALRSSILAVWDLHTGACVRTAPGTPQGIEDVAMSTDGRIAVSGVTQHTDLRVWDLADGSCLRTLTGHTNWVEAVALSADGRVAVSGAQDHTVRVWQVPTARGELAEWSYARPRTAAELLADARAVESAARRATALVDEGDGHGAAEVLRAARALGGHRRDVRLTAVWRRLAGLGVRREVQDVWLQRVLDGVGWVRSVALSGDSRVAAFATEDGRAEVVELATGARLLSLPRSSGSSVALSTDGRSVVRTEGGGLPVWEVAAGTRTDLATHGLVVRCVAVAGTVAVGGSRDAVCVWDLRTGRRRYALVGHRADVTSVAVSGDGLRAVSGSADRTIRVWDVVTGQCFGTISGHPYVASVAVSFDGAVAVSASLDGTLKAWELRTGRCVQTMTGHTDVVWSVAVSADGRVALSGGRDRTVRVWDVVSGECLRTLTEHTDFVHAVALSADGCVAVSGSKDGTVRAWELDWEYGFPPGVRDADITHRPDDGR